MFFKTKLKSIARFPQRLMAARSTYLGPFLTALRPLQMKIKAYK